MKKLHHPLFSRRTLTGFALFGLFALASRSLSAQTFTGRKFLAETPASFRANIHASAQQEAIIIHLDNQSSGDVHIQLLNQAQQPVYNAYVTQPGYHARFDVSALPPGIYTVDLRSRTAWYTQQFLIERSATRHIVMATPPTEPDSLVTDNSLSARKLH